MPCQEQRGTGVEDAVEFLERLEHLGALQMDDAVKRHDPCEPRRRTSEGTHVPLGKGHVGIPLGGTLDHRGGQVYTTDLHTPVFEIPCHMPRSTSRVTDCAPVSDTRGKSIEQLSVQGCAGKFPEARLRLLLGNTVITGCDGPGMRSHW